MYDKTIICEKFINKNHPLYKIDEKLLFYSEIVLDLKNRRQYYDIKSIRINLQPLVDAICEHADDWRITLGSILAEKTYNNMLALKDRIKELRLDMDRNIKGLNDFKTVMQTISTVQSITTTIELKAREMQETYSVLEEHKIDVIIFFISSPISTMVL